MFYGTEIHTGKLYCKTCTSIYIIVYLFSKLLLAISLAINY